ncbi:MAG TPA: hydroxyacylglutathione hydrolase [Gammaproteobacteria bacterium]
MADIKVIPIPAFKDNYIWLLRRPGRPYCAVVDPGDAVPVLKFLRSESLQLIAILITHHHTDHSGGIAALKQAFPACSVFGPRGENIPLLEQRCADGDKLHFQELALDCKVLDIPGHTAGHIAYYSADEEHLLFCGDTMFSVGCGRLFEGTAEQMYLSLQKLTALPDETAVYCGHEYTLQNIGFAKQVEPDNAALRVWEQQVLRLRNAGQPSLPSRLSTELAVNPFLRTNIENVKQAVARYCGESLSAPVDVFRMLRLWKDNL